MPAFESFDGLRQQYAVLRSGPPVVLLHSFPFDSRIWTATGVVPAIAAAGRTAIALDRRGHGQSDKPHDPAAYANNAAARDVSRLLDHLDLRSADLLGYSLGSHVGLRVLQDEPRIRRAVLGGVGADVLSRGHDHAERVANLLETEDRQDSTRTGGHCSHESRDSEAIDSPSRRSGAAGTWRTSLILDGDGERAHPDW